MDTTVDFSAPFTDADIVDTHSAVWNWDDGNTFYQSDVVSPAQASHAYSEVFSNQKGYARVMVFKDDLEQAKLALADLADMGGS